MTAPGGGPSLAAVAAGTAAARRRGCDGECRAAAGHADPLIAGLILDLRQAGFVQQRGQLSHERVVDIELGHHTSFVVPRRSARAASANP
jgi:hypothetical protein